MKPKKRKKKGYQFILLALILLSVIGIMIFLALYSRRENEENYSEMQKATLPTVSLHFLDNSRSTLLHGYAEEMNAVSMRDVIVPLSSERTLSLSIHACGNEVHGLYYEIRSLDGTKFIDSGRTEIQKPDADQMELALRFSDLLESGKEYQLILKTECEARDVYFYARVIYAKTQYTEELLSFAEEFSDATYDREKAAVFLVNYIRPTDDADTTDYYYTDIYSKYSMLTYGSLNVEKAGDMDIRITELEPTQLAVTFSYPITLGTGDSRKLYRVQEFVSARYRSEKVYLLDYHRTVSQAFDPERSLAEKGRIQLGIGSGESQIVSTSKNEYTVFVQDREIWSYNSRTNAMNQIFGFRDEQDDSGRTDYDHHDVQVVKVTEEGDIDYMVYGYMNRGSYEGQVGVCFYRYNQATNSTKRLFFMPILESEQILMMDLGTLAYVNDSDVCYLRYGDTICSIDLQSGESVEVSIRAYPGMYAKNAKGNVVAWQEGEDLTYPDRLVILNMDSQTTIVVDAEDGEFVKILDFIGDDIIYGFGRKEDSIHVANMDMQQLLTRLCIASTEEKLVVRQEYKADGFHILSATAADTHVSIHRGIRANSSELKRIDDDVLLLSGSEASKTVRSMMKSRSSDALKKEYYIQLGTTVNSSSEFSTIEPRFETAKTVNELGLKHHQENVYYVYGYGKLLYVESEINVAIAEAYDAMGVVVDEKMNYLWTRGTRDLFKTISIQPFTAASEEQSLAAALKVVCAQAGKLLPNVEADLESGLSPIDIMNRAAGDGSAVSLYGCTLQEVLYFVNKGYPVLAVTGNRSAVLIVGYETANVSVYMPASGETVKLDNQEAIGYFAGFGNSFISFSDRKD